jgi:hypothetical protein
MSTAETTPPAPAPAPEQAPASLESLVSAGRAVFVGLIWACLMLLVFGFWMRAKGDVNAKINSGIFFASSAAAALLAIWQAFSLWRNESAEQKSQSFFNQRAILGYAFLIAGLGLVVFAYWLGKKPGSFGFALNNFPETIGVLFFGMISLFAGYAIQKPVDEPTFQISFLTQQAPLLKFICLLASLVALGTVVYIIYNNWTGNAYVGQLAELVGVLGVSVIAAAGFFYLNSGQQDDASMRFFVLFVGGALGLDLFVVSCGLALKWREHVFGGMAAWQGDEGWRVWVCAYGIFLALAIMYGSFNIARSDMRESANLRRLMFGYSTVAQVLLLAGILIEANLVINAMYPFTYNWSKTLGAYALADTSKNLIKGVKTETNFVVLIPQGSFVYRDTRVLMDNCQALNNKVKVEYISPDLNQQEYERLAKLFPKILPEARSSTAGRGILIVKGPMPTSPEHTTPYSFVAERKLFEHERMGQNKTVFKGEVEVLKELKHLMLDKSKRKIYVLQGPNEPGITRQDGTVRMEFRHGFGNVGLGILTEKLKQDDYEVFGLTFQPDLLGQKNPNIIHAKEAGPGKHKEIPDDCNVLVIAGPKSLEQDAVSAIEAYADRGGKMVVFLDVFVDSAYSKLEDSGLEPLLKRMGVEVTNEYALRMIQSTAEDPRVLVMDANLESQNPLAKQFGAERIVLYRSARVLKPVDSPRFKAETIMQLDSEEWPVFAEKNVNILKDPQGHIAALAKDRVKLIRSFSQKPLPMVVAVKDAKTDKASMVVFGDTEFITNRELATSQSRREAYSLAVSAMEWVQEREELMGVQPRENNSYSLKLPAIESAGRMVHMPFWLMLLSIIGIGLLVWVTRRR